MLSIVYTSAFATDYMGIELQSKRDEVIEAIERLTVLPIIGSTNLPAYIKRTYGDHVRKLVVKPFDVVYEIDEEEGVVRVLALVHGKRVW